MKERVRCKACGYIMDKDSLGEVCPACGVKKEMFEAYEDKIGEVRRLILEKHLHPVVVHAPQALSLLLVLLALTFPLFSDQWRSLYIGPTLLVLSWVFPVSAVGAILSGVFDAKVRFRKVSTPILVRKLVLGGLLLLASLALLILITAASLADFTVWIAYVVSAVISLGCGALLGTLGSGLTHAAMPGDKIFQAKKKKPSAPKVKE